MKKVSENIKKTVLYDYRHGAKVKDIISRYNISKTSIYRWTQQIKIIPSSSKRYDDYIKLFKAYNELLENYNMLIDLHCFKDSPLEEKKLAVERCRDKYPYSKLCEFIELPRSTYIYYHNSLLTPSNKIVSDGELKKLILEIYNKYEGRTPIKMLTRILKSEENISADYRRVGKIMKSLNLKARYKHTKVINLNKRSYRKNLVKQDFNPDAPNKLWVSDVTELKVNNSKFYLCVILDLYARKVIAYKLYYRNNTNLTLGTFREAFESRGNPEGLIFHSDQGDNYTSHAFRDLLKALHVEQSFSKPGYPYDNACMESFFSQYKKESYNAMIFESKEQLEEDIAHYMYYYNNVRVKKESKKTPQQIEDEYYKKSCGK